MVTVGPKTADVLHVKRRIVEMATHMEGGEIDLFEGYRRIAELRMGLDDETIDDPDVTTFVAIDSELDVYPMGPSRAHWAPEALAEKDRQRAQYLERVRDELLRACREVRLKWASEN